MFRIECFCDDKRLAQVLNALQGLILADPKISPVVNAEAKNGHIKAVTSGTLVEMFQHHIAKAKVKEFDAGYVKDFLVSIGKSKGSYTHLAKGILETGLARRKGNKTGSGHRITYVVRAPS